MADVIPALREFCTRDFEKEGKEKTCLSLNADYNVKELYFILKLMLRTHHGLIRPGSDETQEERIKEHM